MKYQIADREKRDARDDGLIDRRHGRLVDDVNNKCENCDGENKPDDCGHMVPLVR